MSGFEDRVVLITGGSRGIGRACAAAFAEAGATVALCSRNAKASQDTAASLAAEYGATVQGFGCDIAERESVDRLVASVGESLGSVSILVNNAGITHDGLIMRMKDDDWAAVLETNLYGPFYCCRAVSRAMLKQRYGRIVTVSSIVGMRGQGGQSNYAAAKAGLIGFTKALAQELASRNITANVVAPGFIQTDMTGNLSEDNQRKLIESVPVGREGTPGDVANAVLFLASEAASYITGHVLCVDGGLGM